MYYYIIEAPRIQMVLIMSSPLCYPGSSLVLRTVAQKVFNAMTIPLVTVLDYTLIFDIDEYILSRAC